MKIIDPYRLRHADMPEYEWPTGIRRNYPLEYTDLITVQATNYDRKIITRNLRCGDFDCRQVYEWVKGKGMRIPRFSEVCKIMNEDRKGYLEDFSHPTTSNEMTSSHLVRFHENDVSTGPDGSRYYHRLLVEDWIPIAEVNVPSPGAIIEFDGFGLPKKTAFDKNCEHDSWWHFDEDYGYGPVGRIVMGPAYPEKGCVQTRACMHSDCILVQTGETFFTATRLVKPLDPPMQTTTSESLRIPFPDTVSLMRIFRRYSGRIIRS